MRIGILVFAFLNIFSFALAQDTLYLSRQDMESVFLKENLMLIASKMEISEAETLRQQARLWPNPNITLDQVNFWATKSQTGGEEVSPPYFGSFGRNRGLALELEQLIETAGKRKKEVAVADKHRELAELSFEMLLRELKLDLRNKMTELQMLQYLEGIYYDQLSSVTRLQEAFARQGKLGNIPKNEVLRLKSLELKILHEIKNLQAEIIETGSGLKQLLNISPEINLRISSPLEVPDDIRAHFAVFSLENIQERPDLKYMEQTEQLAGRFLDLEQARKRPDVQLKAQYDRSGGIMKNFIGFGLSIDLPVFDRNQGNINHAKIQIDKARINHLHKLNQAQTEAASAVKALENSLQFYENIEGDYLKELDEMLDIYTRNFIRRDLSFLEYVDFLKAFRESKEMAVDAIKEVLDNYERAIFESGRDF